MSISVKFLPLKPPVDGADVGPPVSNSGSGDRGRLDGLKDVVADVVGSGSSNKI